MTRDYEKKLNWTLGENKPNQSQLLPAQSWGLKVDGTADRFSNDPCIFESAVYNLVVRDGNVMHSMTNSRNFDGEYVKWQEHQSQMR